MKEEMAGEKQLVAAAKSSARVSKMKGNIKRIEKAAALSKRQYQRMWRKIIGVKTASAASGEKRKPAKSGISWRQAFERGERLINGESGFGRKSEENWRQYQHHHIRKWRRRAAWRSAKTAK